jgi:hypothetical protein
MALLALAAGILVMAATPTFSHKDGYTAMYMSTDSIDRNITKNHTSLTIPFYVENQEGGTARYRYEVSLLFKDTIFHPGMSAWSEDLNVDEAYNVTSGSFELGGGKTQAVTVTVPVQSGQKWRYANVTIDLYKDGTPGVYRSLRLWAANQVK